MARQCAFAISRYGVAIFHIVGSCVMISWSGLYFHACGMGLQDCAVKHIGLQIQVCGLQILSMPCSAAC